jgi:hypothetical protein
MARILPGILAARRARALSGCKFQPPVASASQLVGVGPDGPWERSRVVSEVPILLSLAALTGTTILRIW